MKQIKSLWGVIIVLIISMGAVQAQESSNKWSVEIDSGYLFL